MKKTSACSIPLTAWRLIVPIVDYLERHGTPAEQTEALLLRARSLEWRGEMEQAQQVYSQALQAALESGDPRMEMRCRQLLTSFYLQRTYLKDEGAQTARRFLQLAEACRDTAAQALAHMYMGRLYFAAIHEDTLYNRPEEGVEHFRQATRLAALAKDQYLEMQSKYELAVLYMTRQQPFEALPLLKETKDYLSSQTPDSKQPILISLIQTYLQLDRPDTAQVYIDEAMTLPDRNNLRYHIYDLLFQYYRAKQQPERSAWAADSMRYYQPMVMKQQLSKQVAEVKEKYANEQLAEAHARVSRERNDSILIGAAVAVALLLIIVFGRKAYRDRLHRRERQLHEKETTIHSLQTHLEEEKAHAEEMSGHLSELEAREQELSHALTNDTELMQRLRKEPKFLNDPEWDKLKAVTDRVYNGFTTRLHERFPQLTEVYIRYCILIKLRFTVSQIAILMAVAPSSVSQQKSRIKKRLQQAEESTFAEGESLDEWIGKF